MSRCCPFTFILEPRRALFHPLCFVISFLFYCFLFLCGMMAQNKRSNLVSEVNTTSRQPVPCRITAAEASAPGNTPKPKAQTSLDKVSWRRVDNEGGNTALQPYVVTYSICHDTSTPPKPSRRRCYTEEEKRQVAETRKRGACEVCRASRTKVKYQLNLH